MTVTDDSGSPTPQVGEDIKSAGQATASVNEDTPTGATSAPDSTEAAAPAVASHTAASPAVVDDAVSPAAASPAVASSTAASSQGGAGAVGVTHTGDGTYYDVGYISGGICSNVIDLGLVASPALQQT